MSIWLTTARARLIIALGGVAQERYDRVHDDLAEARRERSKLYHQRNQLLALNADLGEENVRLGGAG